MFGKISEGKPIAILDYETEMVGDYGDPWPRVLEYGILVVDHRLKKVLRSGGAYVNPERKVLKRIPSLENIDRKQVAKAEVWQAARDSIATNIEGCCVFAWPASFEEAVTKCECVRAGVEVPFKSRVHCLMSIAKALMHACGEKVLEKFSAESVALHLGYKKPQKHRALDDCKMLLHTMRELEAMVALSLVGRAGA